MVRHCWCRDALGWSSLWLSLAYMRSTCFPGSDSSWDWSESLSRASISMWAMRIDRENRRKKSRNKMKSRGSTAKANWTLTRCQFLIKSPPSTKMVSTTFFWIAIGATRLAGIPTRAGLAASKERSSSGGNASWISCLQYICYTFVSWLSSSSSDLWHYLHMWKCSRKLKVIQISAARGPAKTAALGSCGTKIIVRMLAIFPKITRLSSGRHQPNSTKMCTSASGMWEPPSSTQPIWTRRVSLCPSFT